ncbi:Vesicle membrane receptor protein (v-SNARE) [Coemansia sp. RSA 1250]|nr:Vesicle membrane receptor protein (v-SNARE) [Coemansia sp. RSA 1250]
MQTDLEKFWVSISCKTWYDDNGGGFNGGGGYSDGYANDPYSKYSSKSNPMDSSNQSENKAQRVQNEVDDVVKIMQENIDSVMKRGEDLDNVGQKTDRLRDDAQVFQRSAVRVRKKMWWNNMKWKIIIAVCLIIIILVIVLSVVLSKK